MVTLHDIVNEGIIDAQIGVNVYELNDMNGQLLYSGKIGFMGGTQFTKFFKRYRNARVRFIHKHLDEYKELLITLQF